MDTTRVAVITFADEAQIWIDQVTANNVHDHKCSLLGTALPAIKYAWVTYSANKIPVLKQNKSLYSRAIIKATTCLISIWSMFLTASE